MSEEIQATTPSIPENTNEVVLSSQEIKCMKAIGVHGRGFPCMESQFYEYMDEVGWPLPPEKCRERDECLAKLKKLGMVE